MELDTFEYFAKLSNYGRKKNSLLFEHNEKSFGSANPCLVVSGKDSDFEIKALNNLGINLLNFIKKDFSFCDKATYSKGRIYGTLTGTRKTVSEDQRLKLKTHMDIIRTIAFKFKPTTQPFTPYCGLFGITSYNFIDSTEDIPNNNEDLLNDPDYIFYFLDNMFIFNHKAKKTYFVANALITDNKREKIYDDCIKIIKNYEKLINTKVPKTKKYSKKEFKVTYDTSKDKFAAITKDLKGHIFDGNLLYASPSKTAIANYNAEPLDIYAQLKNIIPSPYLFYINDEHGISIGSGAKTHLSVTADKSVELRTATAAKPRGIVKDVINNDLDNKYEAMLKVDENGIIHHIMLADAARDVVARISKPGRYVDKLFFVDKQDKTQNLVLSAKGILKDNLDALHAFIATINFDVGLPKIKAMQLLGKMESKRCFYSGSMVCITPNHELDSITIEPIRLKKDKAYIRTNSMVFHNSIDENELEACDDKAQKFLNVIKSAGGLK